MNISPIQLSLADARRLLSELSADRALSSHPVLKARVDVLRVRLSYGQVTPMQACREAAIIRNGLRRIEFGRMQRSEFYAAFFSDSLREMQAVKRDNAADKGRRGPFYPRVDGRLYETVCQLRVPRASGRYGIRYPKLENGIEDYNRSHSKKIRLDAGHLAEIKKRMIEGENRFFFHASSLDFFGEDGLPFRLVCERAEYFYDIRIYVARPELSARLVPVPGAGHMEVSEGGWAVVEPLPYYAPSRPAKNPLQVAPDFDPMLPPFYGKGKENERQRRAIVRAPVPGRKDEGLDDDGK
ncbi:MAG: hypothetical protein V1728_05705 [Candidatus Micrarchaeota archaeon]